MRLQTPSGNEVANPVRNVLSIPGSIIRKNPYPLVEEGRAKRTEALPLLSVLCQS